MTYEDYEDINRMVNHMLENVPCAKELFVQMKDQIELDMIGVGLSYEDYLKFVKENGFKPLTEEQFVEMLRILYRKSREKEDR